MGTKERPYVIFRNKIRVLYVHVHYRNNNVLVRYAYVKMQLQSWKNFLVLPITRWRGSATGRALDLRSRNPGYAHEWGQRKAKWRTRTVSALSQKTYVPCVRSHLDGYPAPSPKGHSPQFSAHVYCGQTAEWIKMPLATEVATGPGHSVLDGDLTRK